MLKDATAVTNLAVKDLDRARKFYEGTLGLEPVGEMEEEVVTYQTGGSKIYVYRSDFAGTNEATAMTWPVGDTIEEVVKELKAKGVTFEHYENMTDMPLVGDIYGDEKFKVAWFKDPDGNILSLTS